MPAQTPMIGMNCDLGDAMIKTETLRYNHKKARNFKMRFGLLWLFLNTILKIKGANLTLFQQVYPIEKL